MKRQRQEPQYAEQQDMYETDQSQIPYGYNDDTARRASYTSDADPYAQSAAAYNNNSSSNSVAAEPQHRKNSRKRFIWSEDLKRAFVVSVFGLGLEHATPRLVYPKLQASGVQPDLTTEHIKSHLQKWRSRKEAEIMAVLFSLRATPDGYGFPDEQNPNSNQQQNSTSPTDQSMLPPLNADGQYSTTYDQEGYPVTLQQQVEAVLQQAQTLQSEFQKAMSANIASLQQLQGLRALMQPESTLTAWTRLLSALCPKVSQRNKQI